MLPYLLGDEFYGVVSVVFCKMFLPHSYVGETGGWVVSNGTTRQKIKSTTMEFIGKKETESNWRKNAKRKVDYYLPNGNNGRKTSGGDFKEAFQSRET